MGGGGLSKFGRLGQIAPCGKLQSGFSMPAKSAIV
jgi:hypothetical protein